MELYQDPILMQIPEKGDQSLKESDSMKYESKYQDEEFYEVEEDWTKKARDQQMSQDLRVQRQQSNVSGQKKILNKSQTRYSNVDTFQIEEEVKLPLFTNQESQKLRENIIYQDNFSPVNYTQPSPNNKTQFKSGTESKESRHQKNHSEFDQVRKTNTELTGIHIKGKLSVQSSAIREKFKTKNDIQHVSAMLIKQEDNSDQIISELNEVEHRIKSKFSSMESDGAGNNESVFNLDPIARQGDNIDNQSPALIYNINSNYLIHEVDDEEDTSSHKKGRLPISKTSFHQASLFKSQ